MQQSPYISLRQSGSVTNAELRTWHARVAAAHVHASAAAGASVACVAHATLRRLVDVRRAVDAKLLDLAAEGRQVRLAACRHATAGAVAALASAVRALVAPAVAVAPRGAASSARAHGARAERGVAAVVLLAPAGAHCTIVSCIK
jgi:hypothetical protein